MRAIGIMALVGSVAAAVAAAGSVASLDRPRVRVADRAPFTVRGYRFDPAEKLRVVVTTRRRFERHATAGAGGSFRFVLRNVRIGPCAQYSVRAYHGRVLRAGVKGPPPSCGADLAP